MIDCLVVNISFFFVSFQLWFTLYTIFLIRAGIKLLGFQNLKLEIYLRRYVYTWMEKSFMRWLPATTLLRFSRYLPPSSNSPSLAPFWFLYKSSSRFGWSWVCSSPGDWGIIVRASAGYLRNLSRNPRITTGEKIETGEKRMMKL